MRAGHFARRSVRDSAWPTSARLSTRCVGCGRPTALLVGGITHDVFLSFPSLPPTNFPARTHASHCPIFPPIVNTITLHSGERIAIKTHPDTTGQAGHERLPDLFYQNTFFGVTAWNPGGAEVFLRVRAARSPGLPLPPSPLPHSPRPHRSLTSHNAHRVLSSRATPRLSVPRRTRLLTMHSERPSELCIRSRAPFYDGMPCCLAWARTTRRE